MNPFEATSFPPQTRFAQGGPVAAADAPRSFSAKLSSLCALAVGLVRQTRRLDLRILLQAKERRLRVSETVSLGDKRFVSIIEVDGVAYLIGGGSASVSLLTQLASPPQPPGFESALEKAWQTEPGQ